MNEVVFKKKLEGEPLSLTTHLSDLIQCPDDDVYVFYGRPSLMKRA
jgi:hypothetical protein